MKMKRQLFQENLRKEILIYSAIFIAVIILILSFILSAFNGISINMQLDNTEQVVQDFISKNIKQYEEQLTQNSKRLYLDFLNETVSESNIYSNYYTFNSQQDLKSELLILDESMNLKFSSNSRWNKDGIFLNFLSIITPKIDEETEVVQRLYVDKDREHYLLLMTTIGNPLSPEGYSVQVINGKEVISNLNQLQNQYIISDKFDNVFASSSNLFISGNLEKVEGTVFKNRFNYHDDLYYSERSSLTPNLSLTVYQRSIMYPSFLKISGSIVALLSFLLIAFALSFSKRISLRNAKSVELLTKEMEVLKGNPNHRLSIQTNDEFELVSKRINIMLEELSNAHQNNISLLQENLLAERKKLEAQFNPHFLYNTLEVIRASIIFDREIANQLILRLTKILRYSINEENTEVTFETDLTYLIEYLEISRIRFQDFSYILDINEETLKLPVPKLFLLPLIENSLKYGFQNRPDLQITIISKKIEDNYYQFQVMDNGSALEERKSQEINDSLQNNLPMGNHHGLLNSKKRLQLMYPKAKFELKIREEYTVVEIEIGGA